MHTRNSLFRFGLIRKVRIFSVFMKFSLNFHDSVRPNRTEYLLDNKSLDSMDFNAK
jgi:hypothetical protein